MKRTAIDEAKAAAVEAFWRVAREHGSPVAVARLREACGLGKAEFDAACLELLREGRIYMAPHDHALRLPAEERERLVADGSTFYCSFSLRGLSCWRRQPDGAWAPRTAA
jgi:hypothetical protein